MADRIFFQAKGLTGGGANDLDFISVSGISDDDMAFVIVSDVFYVYQYDSASAAAEDSPNVIKPDDAGATGRWILQKTEINKIQKAQYAADAEASDAYVVTLDPAPAAYFAGMKVNFKANTANTGAATLNVNTLGAKTIKKQHDQDLKNNDIESGQIVTVVYDGTNFQMQSQLATTGLVEAKLVTFSINTVTASGTQVVSGVGFQPSHVIFIGVVNSTSEFSIGFDDGTIHYTIGDRHGSVANTWSSLSNKSIYLMQAASVNYTGYISALSSDGFTITWTKTGAKTGTATIFALCFK